MNWQEILTYIIIAGAVMYIIVQLYKSFVSKKAKSDGCCSCNGQCGTTSKHSAF